MAESLNSSFLRTKQQKGKKEGNQEETRNDDNDDGGGRGNEPNAQALYIFSWRELPLLLPTPRRPAGA